MKVIDSIWFTPMGGGCIGVVRVIDEVTQICKYYIGNGMGVSMEADEQRIAQMGSKFPAMTGDQLFGVQP